MTRHLASRCKAFALGSWPSGLSHPANSAVEASTSQFNFATQPALSKLRALLSRKVSNLFDSLWRQPRHQLSAVRPGPSSLSTHQMEPLRLRALQFNLCASTFAGRTRDASAVKLSASFKLSRKVLKLPGSICAQDNICGLRRQSNSN